MDLYTTYFWRDSSQYHINKVLNGFYNIIITRKYKYINEINARKNLNTIKHYLKKVK